MRNLVYLRDVNENSFLLLSTRKETARLRAYPEPSRCEEHGCTTTQVLQMLNHADAIRLPADDVPHERIDFWCARISAVNEQYGLAGPPLPASAGSAAPSTTSPSVTAVSTPPIPTTATLRSLEARIAQLANKFTASPNDFFHEKELHAAFFFMCRSEFGEESPRGAKLPIQLFRHEYDTLWRYRRSDQFTQRYDTEGTTACLDFALLDRSFVLGHDLYTVVNKNELFRKGLRVATGPSPAIVVGLEFKMAIARSAAGIGASGVQGLREGMLADCRKLAWERVQLAYVLGFSHGPRPHLAEAEEVADACLAESRQYNPDGDARILVATPARRVQRGNWDVLF